MMSTRNAVARRGRLPRAPYTRRTTGTPRSQTRTTSSSSRSPPPPVISMDETLETSCIDLTDDDHFDEIVDLTSVNDSPVVRVGNQTSYQRQSSPSGQISPVVIDHADDSSGELPEVDFGQLNKRAVNSANVSLSPEDAKVTVQCPICFDSVKEIRKTQRKLMCTVCGHLFCDVCITEAIHKHKCCPACRKRLTMRQIHAIYL